MQSAGIIIEYNPLHGGHLHLLREIRARLGPDTALVGVMSGNFVQRGDFALLNKHARARAAVESGLDLVLELPLPWAVSSAEEFAAAGVEMLTAAGVVDTLAFGSEGGDAAPLAEIAACLDSPACQAGLRRFLDEGMSYAAARQGAVAGILGPERAALLDGPNNILGIAYCKALLRQNSPLRPMTVRRAGAGYHDLDTDGVYPSATALRALVRAGREDEALGLMAPAMARAYRAERSAGRAPVLRENGERALLARLRTMTAEDFTALEGGEAGLGNRLYQAVRAGTALEDILQAAKTRRYPYTRLSRMVLWAYLGLTPADIPAHVPYLRVLAAGERGRALLGRMRKEAALPVLTKPADVRLLGGDARRLFDREVRATDLYTLAYPALAAAQAGAEWRQGPVIV